VAGKGWLTLRIEDMVSKFTVNLRWVRAFAARVQDGVHRFGDSISSQDSAGARRSTIVLEGRSTVRLRLVGRCQLKALGVLRYSPAARISGSASLFALDAVIRTGEVARGSHVSNTRPTIRV